MLFSVSMISLCRCVTPRGLCFHWPGNVRPLFLCYLVTSKFLVVVTGCSARSRHSPWEGEGAAEHCSSQGRAPRDTEPKDEQSTPEVYGTSQEHFAHVKWVQLCLETSFVDLLVLSGKTFMTKWVLTWYESLGRPMRWTPFFRSYYTWRIRRCVLVVAMAKMLSTAKQLKLEKYLPWTRNVGLWFQLYSSATCPRRFHEQSLHSCLSPIHYPNFPRFQGRCSFWTYVVWCTLWSWTLKHVKTYGLRMFWILNPLNMFEYNMKPNV